MRLIDADKLKDLLSFASKSGVIKMAPSLVAEMIDSVPTVDPVKHGHWIEGGEDDCLCSCCRSGWYEFDDEEELKAWERIMLFCPHCGAQMNEEACE